MNDDNNSAFGRGGYVWEGLSDAGHGFGKLLVILALIAVGVFVARWLYAEYWITTHCTTVLGTRVCQ